ncbi:unnamed protein product [marine sediment metagenome]|uniref:Uncharacterized protein n=1 Tax=marine sediment metagenome TaxID=412755 RepID=X1QVG0_9ZZZZ
MSEGEEKALAEVEAEVKVEEHKSDIFDGIANVIVAGEVAHRDGRTEGRNIVVEVPEDGQGEVDIINVGRKDLLADFHRVLDKDKVKYRDIVVEADVTESPEKMAKLGDMAQRQVEAAQATERRKALEAKMGWPALPGILERGLERIEDKLPDLPGSEVNKEGGQESGRSEAEE